MNIGRIIDYFGFNFFGSPGWAEDVKVKYLCDDEPYPYWFIKGDDGVRSMEEYKALDEFVRSQGGVLEFGQYGFYVTDLKYVEKKEEDECRECSSKKVSKSTINMG